MYDLNVPWPQSNYDPISNEQLISLKNIISTLYSLECRRIAINFEIDEGLKIPINDPSKINPIKIDEIIDIKQFPGLQIFTRLTISVNDSSKLINFNKFQNYFDIISIKPLNEKALQLSILNLNIDLISFNLNTKLNFYLKHKIIGQGVKKGIKFELCYNSLISNTYNSSSRRYFISNLIQLIRATRSNGLIISSGATSAINIRTLPNIMTFLSTIGLKTNQINQFIKNSELVLINGRLRIKSYKQTLVVGDSTDLYDNSIENPKNNNDLSPYKRPIGDTEETEDTKKRKL